jgi:hypothetical protein
MQKRGAIDFWQTGTQTPQGEIVFHDLTEYGLGRLCVELPGRWPDLETWLDVLHKRGLAVKLYRYTERIGRSGLNGLLWFYYAGGQQDPRKTSWYQWEKEV